LEVRQRLLVLLFAKQSLGAIVQGGGRSLAHLDDAIRQVLVVHLPQFTKLVDAGGEFPLSKESLRALKHPGQTGDIAHHRQA
jgi:hypothetical protein